MTVLLEALNLTWWGFLLLYLLAGWVTAGVFVWFRQPMNNRRMVVCLLIWWGAAIAFLLGLLVSLVRWVFDPDDGPIAMFVGVVKAAGAPRASPGGVSPPPAADVTR
jgi:hypothetical protein